MSNSNVKNIRLGLFVIIGILLLAGGVYVIGKKQSLFNDSIKIYALFERVNGLQKGSNVRFLGINVGTVKDISVLSDTAVLVTLSVNYSLKEYLRKDATASIGSEGIMGDIVLSLIPTKEHNAPLIKEYDTVFTRRAISIEDLMRTFDVTNKNVAKISIILNDMIENIHDGKGLLGSLVSDSTMEKDVKEAINNFKTISQNSNALVKDLASFTRQIQKPGTIGYELKDTSFGSDFTQSIQNLKKASKQSAEITNSLMKFTDELNNDKGLASKLVKDSTLANDFQDALINVKEGANNLNQTLKALQKSFLLRGAFKKLEKEEKKGK